jgi:hypothetical protein
VTLSIGGNDLLNLLNDPSDACVADPTGGTCQALMQQALLGAAARYPTIVGSIQAALLAEDADPEQVFVMTLYNPFGGTASVYEPAADLALLGGDLAIDCHANQVDTWRIGLNDIIACTSLALGAVPVDGYTAIGDDAPSLTHIASGDIHPNDDGYARLAQAHRRAAGAR